MFFILYHQTVNNLSEQFIMFDSSAVNDSYSCRNNSWPHQIQSPILSKQPSPLATIARTAVMTAILLSSVSHPQPPPQAPQAPQPHALQRSSHPLLKKGNANAIIYLLITLFFLFVSIFVFILFFPVHFFHTRFAHWGGAKFFAMRVLECILF